MSAEASISPHRLHRLVGKARAGDGDALAALRSWLALHPAEAKAAAARNAKLKMLLDKARA